MTPNAISLELGDLFAQFRISGRSAVFDRYHIVSCADLKTLLGGSRGRFRARHTFLRLTPVS